MPATTPIAQAPSCDTISAVTVWRGVAPSARITAWLRAASRAAKVATMTALMVASASSRPAVPNMTARIWS
jgi:hypothetical protein